jgi:hypothetical protein
MDKREYQEMKQAFKEQREFFKANPAAAKEYLDTLGVGNLFGPKKASAEIDRELAYPCTSEYLPVDLNVFLCD